MRLNERISGGFFHHSCWSWGFFDLLGDLAGDLLFLLGGGAHESDRDMAGTLQDRTGRAFGPGLEATKSRSSTDDGFLDNKGRCIERKIIFGICDGGLESFTDQLCKISRALETARPWISRATSRAFLGERRTNLVVLLTSMERRT